MRKLALSIGLAAVGTAGLHAQDSSSMQNSKIWTLSGDLRGFYDDNYNTAPPGPAKRGSFGVEVSPSFGIHIPLDQTQFGFTYTYGLYYYQDREDSHQNPFDQTHQANVYLSHAFSETWQGTVSDSFVVAQDPQLLTPNAPAPTTQRVNGNNISNNGSIEVDTKWTDLFGTKLSYDNTLYDYQQHGGTAAAPSLAGLLNDDQNLASLDFQWQVTPVAIAFVGYQYGQNIYTGNEPIAVGYMSQNRDSRSQYGYLGVQYTPIDTVKVVLKGGAQYINFYNPPAGVPATSSTTPYLDLSASYNYTVGSYAMLGFTQTRNTSSIVTENAAGQITDDEKSSRAYGSINHQFSPQLTGSFTGSFDYLSLQGGQYNDSTEKWYSFGLSFSYAFNLHVSAEIGYNFDDYLSNIPGQKYERNRAFLGVTATY